jgi:hypothetical protein
MSTNYNKLTRLEKLALIKFFPEEAKKDENRYIRLNAYRTLGFTKEALEDNDEDIQREAKIYLDYIKQQETN